MEVKPDNPSSLTVAQHYDVSQMPESTTDPNNQDTVTNLVVNKES